MENNIQVQKAADISSLAGVVIVSLSALTAYNIGEKFNHNILFDATIFIISLVMLILTFAIFRKVMAGLLRQSQVVLQISKYKANVRKKAAIKMLIKIQSKRNRYLIVWRDMRAFLWKSN